MLEGEQVCLPPGCSLADLPSNSLQPCTHATPLLSSNLSYPTSCPALSSEEVACSPASKYSWTIEMEATGVTEWGLVCQEQYKVTSSRFLAPPLLLFPDSICFTFLFRHFLRHPFSL